MRSSSSNSRSRNATTSSRCAAIGDDVRDGDVPLPQVAEVGARAVDVAGAGVGGNAEQSIGDLRQRRDDDDRAARVAAFLLGVGLALRANDGDQPLDGGLIRHRGAAELHDDHVQSRSVTVARYQ